MLGEYQNTEDINRETKELAGIFKKQTIILKAFADRFNKFAKDNNIKIKDTQEYEKAFWEWYEKNKKEWNKTAWPAIK